MAEFDLEGAARFLRGARGQRERPSDLPETLRPRTIEEAYAVQTATVRALGGTGGWKFVARRGDQAPRCAPIPAKTFFEAPAVVPPEGLVGPEVEAEVAVRFARDLPAKRAPYAERDVLAAIGTLHPALEILSSRYDDRTKAHPLSTLADLLSSAGVVLGPGIQGWDRFDLARIAVAMSVDGVEVAKAETGPGNGALLETLTWLVNLPLGVAMRSAPVRS